MTTDRPTQNNPNGPTNTTTSAPTPPPNNLEAEDAILGAALLSTSALETLATKLMPNDFYSPANAALATVLIEAFEQRWPADPVTVADKLNRRGELEKIGGPGRLITLQANTPATSNAGHYAEIIHSDATLRRLIKASQLTAEMAFGRPFDVHEAVNRAQANLNEVAAQNGARSYSSLDIPNMADVIAGDIEQEQPTILQRSDGQALFYAGKMHVLQAEPSSGKSWIALYAAIEVMTIGGTVIYLDYEDSSAGIASRLLALGADPDAISKRFQYVRPSGEMGTQEKAELASLFHRMNPDLVVIDGVAEAISRDGFDEDRNSEVVKWVDQFPRWITQISGAAVVMIDHIAKDKERGGRYARGASHKLAAVDGASYQVKIIHSFSRHQGGSVKLVVAKDRPGVFTIGQIAAIVKIEPSADGAVVRMDFEKPKPVAADESWKPTQLMEKISLELERAVRPLRPNLVVDMVRGNNKASMAIEALSRLQAENYVTEFTSARAKYLRLIAPYRQGDGPRQPLQPTLIDEKVTTHDDDPGPIEPTD